MKKGSKNTEETKKRISETCKRKGIKPPIWTNDKISFEHRQKMIKSHLGKKPSNETREKLSKSVKNSYKENPDLIEKRRKNLIGERNPLWKNNKMAEYPLRNQIRQSFKYRQWRSDVFTKDNFTCQECGLHSGLGKAVILEAHHTPKSFSEIIEEYQIKTLEESLNCEELWNINNGRTLCYNCHKKTKNGRK